MRDQLTESWGRPPNLDNHMFEVRVDEKNLKLEMYIVPVRGEDV